MCARLRTLLSSIFVASVLLAGCAGVQPQQEATSPAAWISPEEAVHLAAKAAPEGVPGIFALRVQATGTQSGRFYLNSELDYRDQRNLTIALGPQVAVQLAERLGLIRWKP